MDLSYFTESRGYEIYTEVGSPNTHVVYIRDMDGNMYRFEAAEDCADLYDLIDLALDHRDRWVSVGADEWTETVHEVLITERNIHKIRDQIGPVDMKRELMPRMIISYYRASDGAHVLIIYPCDRGRAAICRGGESVWGDWDPYAGVILVDGGGAIEIPSP